MSLRSTLVPTFTRNPQIYRWSPNLGSVTIPIATLIPIPIPARLIPNPGPLRPHSTMTTPSTSGSNGTNNAAATVTTKQPLLYANKTFRSSSNTPNGEVSSATTFTYHQDASTPHIVWAEYSGGSITRGFLIATVHGEDQSLDARYQHVNEHGELMTGQCRTKPVILEDGRVRLMERWKWTSGDLSEGESVVEEVREPAD